MKLLNAKYFAVVQEASVKTYNGFRHLYLTTKIALKKSGLNHYLVHLIQERDLYDKADCTLVCGYASLLIRKEMRW